MNYSYQFNSQYQNSSNCQCHEQIQLLQEKLRQIHSKLIRQIDICKDQETTIISLKDKLGQLDKPHLNYRNVYQTFDHHANKDKENYYPTSNYDQQSRQGYLIKNKLLQSDLDVMRHRVLTEITQKNKILQEMGDMKKKHRKQMAMEIKKFEGLDIVYRRLLQDKGINIHQTPLKARVQIEKLTKQLQEVEQRYQKERQRSRLMEFQNKSLVEKLRSWEEKHRYSKEQSKKTEQESSDQLREIDTLKQQISRINKTISQRQVQFKEKSVERKKVRQYSRQDLPKENVLVEQRWGRRQYS